MGAVDYTDSLISEYEKTCNRQGKEIEELEAKLGAINIEYAKLNNMIIEICAYTAKTGIYRETIVENVQYIVDRLSNSRQAVFQLTEENSRLRRKIVQMESSVDTMLHELRIANAQPSIVKYHERVLTEPV